MGKTMKTTEKERNEDLLDSEVNQGRRRAVKTIVGGVSAIAAYHVLPVRWDKPIIDQIFLPAHAATSGATINDPCTLTTPSDSAIDDPVVVNVSGFVTPPTAGITIQLTATVTSYWVGSGASNVSTTTTTLANGTYSASISITNSPWAVRDVSVTASSIAGNTTCSVEVPISVAPPE